MLKKNLVALILLFSIKLFAQDMQVFEIKKPYLIVIDPGHGGKDLGAYNKDYKISEKEITLFYAEELKKELQKYPFYQVYMVRDNDQYISKEKRLEIIKSAQPNILISLHADYNDNKNINGASIYTLSQDAISKEMQNSINNNGEVKGIITDIFFKNTLKKSLCLAKMVNAALEDKIAMLPNAQRSADLRVLKGIDIPAILFELGYISNDEEINKLINQNYKDKIIYFLVEGIHQYFVNCRPEVVN
jgi:N-acetylmuramoyl-L-alanine amidase